MSDTTRTAPEYAPIEGQDLRAGDEIYLADQWLTTGNVTHMPGGRVVVTWPVGGGRVSGPAHHFMARRRITAEGV